MTQRWEPFERAGLQMPSAEDVARDYNVALETARILLANMKNDIVWMNNRYQVNIRPAGLVEGQELLHVSIKRLDKEPIHDWRDLQRIKNELVGEECEGLELYPAESRRVDAANQYHLWVFKEPGIKIPMGFFGERLVSDDQPGNIKQRRLEP